MLPLDASAADLAELRALLDELAEDPLAFDFLFGPLTVHQPVILPPRLRHGLLRFSLASGDPDSVLSSLHRIRRHGGRYYVLEVGGVTEYRQDVWPETDALLAVLEGAPPGRLLDCGSGSGIVAIEAAARGHAVVATDLYPRAVDLTRFNARLNGLEDALDLRTGHLFEPVAGERFDLILTAPHYSQIADQLRLEALRDGPRHVADGGRLVVATQLEWEGEDGPLPVVELLLRPLAAAGHEVTVEPIVAPLKRRWFALSRPGAPLPGLVSRHRFLVTVRPGTPDLRLTRPASDAQPVRHCFPLGRWPAAAPGPGSLRAVVSTPEDLARLDGLLDDLAAGFVTLDGPLPADVLDLCRFGHRPCVLDGRNDGAAGAILGLDGDVHPCAGGPTLGRLDDTLASLHARLDRLAAEPAARRGCAACPASSVCSRCLNPAPLDEQAYCDLVRSRAATLPLLHRLVETLGHLDRAGLSRCRRLQVKTRPGSHRLLAPRSPGEGEPDDPLLATLARRWREQRAWLLTVDDLPLLSFEDEGSLVFHRLDLPSATLAEAVAEGATPEALRLLGGTLGLSAERARACLAQVSLTLANDLAASTTG